jgi:TPR repeat protein
MIRSADQNYPDAVGGLGYFYMTGTGVPLDREKAIGYFRKGVELGSAKANLNLGLCLLGEQGGLAASTSADAETSTEQGLDLVRQAADEDLPEAAARLGKYYYFGEHGLAKDNRLAMPWLELAANAGDAASQNILGVIYEKELMGALDVQAAEAWYRKAALQGDGKAQANLGSLLAHNDRKPEDRIGSIAWLMVSRNGGEITATKTLENIDATITPEERMAAVKMSKKLDADIRKNLRLLRSRSN